MSDKKTVTVEMTASELDDTIAALRDMADGFRDDGDDELVAAADCIDPLIERLLLAKKALR